MEGETIKKVRKRVKKPVEDNSKTTSCSEQNENSKIPIIPERKSTRALIANQSQRKLSKSSSADATPNEDNMPSNVGHFSKQSQPSIKPHHKRKLPENLQTKLPGKKVATEMTSQKSNRTSTYVPLRSCANECKASGSNSTTVAGTLPNVSVQAMNSWPQTLPSTGVSAFINLKCLFRNFK